MARPTNAPTLTREALAELARLAKLPLPDCGDNSCGFGGAGKGGMRTNGGCRCTDAHRIHIYRLARAAAQLRDHAPALIAAAERDVAGHELCETTRQRLWRVANAAKLPDMPLIAPMLGALQDIEAALRGTMPPAPDVPATDACPVCHRTPCGHYQVFVRDHGSAPELHDGTTDAQRVDADEIEPEAGS